MFLSSYILAVSCIASVKTAETSQTCRERSKHFRQDGGLCFEIPPWQHQPVEVEQHLDKLRGIWGNSSITRRARPKLALINSEVTRYMDTVIAPFLDTYHRNIQTSYQQFTSKILRRIKEGISAAVKRKVQVYNELTELADTLHVPEMCNEERRAARTVASRHVAQIYQCTEEARTSMVKMAKYAEDMISITRNHMQASITDATRTLNASGPGVEGQNTNVTTCLKELSRAAVSLGYELDLSLTNARRHNEQSCEKLTNCIARARKNTEDAVSKLRDQLFHEVTRYMDTVIAPFLDTYHRNIQTSYQQFTSKILRRIKEGISAAVKRKVQIYNELTELADSLHVPEMCNEERRAARTVASRHVAQIYQCTEEARTSMVKMAKYAEDMISITRNHMQASITDATRTLNTTGPGVEGQNTNVTTCLKELSRAAVSLGYELDLSLTNARRHNEQSCEKLTNCITRARKNTEDAVSKLRDQLFQCVYA